MLTAKYQTLIIKAEPSMKTSKISLKKEDVSTVKKSTHISVPVVPYSALCGD